MKIAVLSEDDTAPPGLTRFTERLARDILAGAFGPEGWLKQSELEQRYGRTRMEVRRALDHLALRRIVRHEPNRGYRVFCPDAQQMEELRTVRLVLETAAADLTIGHASVAGIAELRRLAAAFATAVSDAPLIAQYEANLAFHAALLALCPNAELARLAEETRQRMPSALLIEWRNPTRIAASVSDHFEIVDALEAGDATRLRAAITWHITRDAA